MPATSWSMLFQGRRAAHTLLLILSLSVSATNVWIVATILPSVVADIGGAEFYAWSSMLYTVAAAATWVYGVSVIAPATITLLTLRVLWCHQLVWPPFGQVSSKAANRA